VRFADQASIRPHRCAVLPYMGNSNASGWIDTGSKLDMDHVYVSFEAVCEMAQMLGWVGPSVLREKEAQIASLRAVVEQRDAELAEADKLIQASRYSLESFGGKVKHKPGPRPKQEETVA
jgi:hypothetical protein